MFIGYIKSNVQMTHAPRNPKSWVGGFYYAGKLLTGKNMADWGQNRHFFPAMIIPSKVK